MTTRFYGRAEQAANGIVTAFKQPDSLPVALAPMFIRRRDDVPCRRWSWGNQLIAALHGHADARGFKQWQAVGRNVRKGERAFYILAPVTRKVERERADGTKETAVVPVAFKAAAVFGLSQTEGEPLPGDNPELVEWVDSLPLVDVARSWGLAVETFDGRRAHYLGAYVPESRITLGVQNLATWAHELTHAADDRCVGGLKRGQDVSQEIVAELGASVLLRLLGEDHEADLGGCWEYVSAYAERANVEPVAACLRLLERTCNAVALILDTAEQVASKAEAVA